MLYWEAIRIPFHDHEPSSSSSVIAIHILYSGTKNPQCHRFSGCPLQADRVQPASLCTENGSVHTMMELIVWLSVPSASPKGWRDTGTWNLRSLDALRKHLWSPCRGNLYWTKIKKQFCLCSKYPAPRGIKVISNNLPLCSNLVGH